MQLLRIKANHLLIALNVVQLFFCFVLLSAHDEKSVHNAGTPWSAMKMMTTSSQQRREQRGQDKHQHQEQDEQRQTMARDGDSINCGGFSGVNSNRSSSNLDDKSWLVVDKSKHQQDQQQQHHYHAVYESTAFTLERQSDGNWIPSAKELETMALQMKQESSNLLPKLEKLLFSSSSLGVSTTTATRRQQQQQRLEFLAFVRIPKTGSTSVISLLQKAKGVATVDAFLNSNFVESGAVDNYWHQLGCIYGFDNHGIIPTQTPIKKWVCPHISLSRILANALQIIVPYLPQQKRSLQNQQQQVSIHPFTIVRDPFDRWVSFFYYMYSRRERPMWKKNFSKEQNNRVAAGDLPGWLELIHRDGTDKDVIMLNQEMFISENILQDNHDGDTAFSWIHNGRILVMVMECFDVSILLLQQIFPHILDAKQVQAWLASEDEKFQNTRPRQQLAESHKQQDKQESNSKEEEDDDQDDEEESEEEDEEEEKNKDDDGANDEKDAKVKERRRLSGDSGPVDLTALRAQARAWFPRHFEFYRVVVERFQNDVSTALASPDTLLTRMQVNQCFHILNEKLRK